MATNIAIVKGGATLGNKAFSPNDIKIKVGSTVVWTNKDNNIHTVTSGLPNTPYAGQVFDSGLASLITPSASYPTSLQIQETFPTFVDYILLW